MTTIIENGKRYDIEDGRVVAAAAAEPEEIIKLTTQDRVSHGSKLGTIVGLVPSVYGSTAVVKFDDGSIDELLLEDLLPSNTKVASVEESDDIESEYNAYLGLPTDSSDDIKLKASKARELNLRAKAMATNGKSPLADQITYDRIVTATAVDILDLDEFAMYAKAEEENYLESLPKYRLPDQVSGAFGMTRGGDASWLALAADEFEVPSVEDSELAKKANAAVSTFSRQELEDDNFMDLVLGYAKASFDDDHSDRFAHLFREARTQRLSESEETVSKTASTIPTVDLDGNEIDLDSLPVEALYGD